jgi:hypothetical protein
MSFKINDKNGSYSIVVFASQDEDSEENEAKRIINLLEDKYGFKCERDMLNLALPNFPAYYSFQEKNGVQLTIVLDEWRGVILDSNNREFLKELMPHIKSLLMNENTN